MNAECITCGASFEREKKRGRPAVRCPTCRGGVVLNPVLPSAPVEKPAKPAKAKPAPPSPPAKLAKGWAIYECPTCKYRTKQLACAIEVMCVERHIKPYKMVIVTEDA